MAARIYRFPTRKAKSHERDELAAAVREITQAVNMIAEETRRRQIIRTCRIIARRERRDANRGPEWPS